MFLLFGVCVRSFDPRREPRRVPGQQGPCSVPCGVRVASIALRRLLQPVPRPKVQDGFREERGQPPGDVLDGDDSHGTPLPVDEW